MRLLGGWRQGRESEVNTNSKLSPLQASLVIEVIADKGVNKRTLIDSYMRFSRIRKKIGSGNWSALNKSGKQLYKDLKNRQKNKIVGWMYEAYKRQVNDGLSKQMEDVQ